MYLDKQNLFSVAQAVTATAAGTNIIDLGPGDTGRSESVSLFVHALPFTGSGTLTVELQTADELNPQGGLKNPLILASYPVSTEQLKSGGKVVASRLPHGLKQYVGINYVVKGSLADGAFTGGLVWDVQAEG